MIVLTDTNSWGPFLDGRSVRTGIAVFPDGSVRYAEVVRRGSRAVVHLSSWLPQLPVYWYGELVEYHGLLAKGHLPWRGEVEERGNRLR